MSKHRYIFHNQSLIDYNNYVEDNHCEPDSEVIEQSFEYSSELWGQLPENESEEIDNHFYDSVNATWR
jgi:hypothetical protein